MASMTGYGRVQAVRDGREMTVELKSVNHRFLDLSFRMPRVCNFLETDARRVLGERLVRGHVDINIQYRNLREDAREVLFDPSIARAYIAAMDRISEDLGKQNSIEAHQVAALPDVLLVREKEENPEEISALFAHCLEHALASLVESRRNEGERMAADVEAKLVQLEGIVDFIAERAPHLAREWHEKLAARMADFLENLQPDPARIIQEAGLLAERAAVDEELVRLRAHIASARSLLGQPATGKKLDFTVQEMNREMNTIGSKASDLSMVSMVVEGKAVIEKIREQVQNLE